MESRGSCQTQSIGVMPPPVLTGWFSSSVVKETVNAPHKESMEGRFRSESVCGLNYIFSVAQCPSSSNGSGAVQSSAHQVIISTKIDKLNWTLKAQTTARPSADRQSFQGFEDVTPTESNGMGDLNVRQVTPSHPLLDAAGRFLEPGGQFAFGEEFVPSVRNGRGRHRCSNLYTLRR